ncbi:unnamed protein product [Albugo candida]|uniref:DNA topoisomerase (ATP-hydrolyzing) n=1 Tax=Albugo candida TaxID=65357 RepID=A0A024FWE2_9STRA|nr:unnamed protein product [Albugo candida]|eukprot:CCI11361.1 unnamed protein product [Albugo candida]
MADQVHNGSHIAINSLNHFWPSLLKIKVFMHEFITPIVNCANERIDRLFYTLPECELCRLATKMVKDKRNHIFPIYRRLQWIPALKMKKLATPLLWHFSKSESKSENLVAMIRN